MSKSKLITFNAMWDGHPDIADGDHNPCKNDDGTPAYGNECAIRMGIALKRAGVKVPKKPKAFPRLAHCWERGHGDLQHVLRAEVLAKWLRSQRKLFGSLEKKIGKKHDAAKGVDWTHFQDRYGIVFFKDFWSRVVGENADGSDKFEKHPSGDHIDVWNGKNQAGYFNSISPNTNDYFERSRQIWFWELPTDGSPIVEP